MSRTLEAVFLENEALRRQWSKLTISEANSPPSGAVEPPPEPESVSVTAPDTPRPEFVAIYRVSDSQPSVDPQASGLLREAVEFVLLELLSTHLSSYFSDRGDEDKLIAELRREDVPDLLMQNRVLALLSEPLENRAVFLKYASHGNQPEGEVVYVRGRDGAFYSRFDLRLPKGTQVSRPETGKVRLQNSRLSVELGVNYQGFKTSLPSELVYFWTGKEISSFDYHLIRLSFRGRVRPMALFKPAGWKDHQWVDSFAERLRNFADKVTFLRRIGWDSLSAQLHVNIALQRQLLLSLSPQAGLKNDAKSR